MPDRVLDHCSKVNNGNLFSQGGITHLPGLIPGIAIPFKSLLDRLINLLKSKPFSGATINCKLDQNGQRLAGLLAWRWIVEGGQADRMP